jgi:hypothetical protein
MVTYIAAFPFLQAKFPMSDGQLHPAYNVLSFTGGHDVVPLDASAFHQFRPGDSHQLLNGEMTFDGYEEVFYAFARPLKIHRPRIAMPYRTVVEIKKTDEVFWPRGEI